MNMKPDMYKFYMKENDDIKEEGLGVSITTR